MNSSYVLIENASFRSRLGNGGIHTLSAARVSILHCHGTAIPFMGLLAVCHCQWLLHFAPWSGEIFASNARTENLKTDK